MNKFQLRCLVYFLFIGLFVTRLVDGQDFFGRSKKLFSKAIEQKEVGNYTEAAENLSKIIRKYPKSEIIQEAYYQHGAVLFRQYEWQYWQMEGLHKYFQALHSFRQVNTTVDSLAAKSLYMQARCFRRIDPRMAMPLYDSVAQRYPDDHLADDALFMSAYIDPYPQSAIAKYQRLREQYPGSEHDLGALYRLLQLYRKVGDYTMSSELCQEFMERYPDSYYSQTVFLNYVSNLLMAGDREEAVRYVLDKMREVQQLREQIPLKYRDLPENELWRTTWTLRYKKDSTSENNRKLIQHYLDSKGVVEKAVAILDIAIPAVDQPVLSSLDSLYFTAEVFQNFHVTKALLRAYDNLRRGNYVQAANISLSLVNNPLIRDPSEAYWILGQAYPRYYLPSMAFQSLKAARKGLVSPEDRMACLNGMIKYAPGSITVEATLREAIADTSFSSYDRVKLAARLMRLLNMRGAELKEVEAVSNPIGDLENRMLGPVHKTLASIYFGRGLLDEAEGEADKLVGTAPDEAVNILLRCAFYRRYINDDQTGSHSLLDKALGICSQAGLQKQQSEVIALVKEWK